MENAHRRISIGRRWAVPAVCLFALAAGTGVLISPAAPAPAAQAAPTIATATPPPSTLAILRRVPIPGGVNTAGQMAIDDTDDTVYIGSSYTSPGRVLVLNGTTGTIVDAIVFNYSTNEVYGVAVDDADDTLYAVLNDSSSLPPRIAASSGRNLDDSTLTPTYVANALKGLSVNSIDDSVYGTDGASAVAFRGQNLDDSRTLSLLNGDLCTVAVDSVDDTAFFAGGSRLSAVNGGTLQIATSISVPTGPGCQMGLAAVNGVDDSVYVTNYSGDYVSVVDGRRMIVDDTIQIGQYPFAIAVDQSDDTVYVTNSNYSPFESKLSIIDGRRGISTDDSINFGSFTDASSIAVDQAGVNQGLVYVVDKVNSFLSVIGRVSPTAWPPAGLAGSSVTVTVDAPQVSYDLDSGAVAQVYFDNTGVTPTAGAGDTWSVNVPAGSGTVQVSVKFRGGLMASAGTFTYGIVAPFAPTLAPLTAGDDTIGLAWTEGFNGGSAVTSMQYATSPNLAVWSNLDDSVSPSVISVDGQGNALVPGQTYTVKLRAVNGVGPGVASNSQSVTLTTPPTPPTPPAPPLTNPPSPPRDVTAAAGDGQITATWEPAASPGDFPVTNYEVRTSPGGATCLVPAPTTSCTIGGLTNGTAYTFEVRALNGAGWGSWSTASAPVTPTPSATKSILITGSRTTVKDQPGVKATGTTVGLAATIVQARVHVAGELDYFDGSVRTVAPDGGFTWQRKTGKKVYVFFRSLTDPGVRSNRVVIPAA
jgi:YVTN family beta-propeller protein